MPRTGEQKFRNILVEQDGPLALVTMNRPEKRNALSEEHMLELIDAFRRIGDQRETAVAILRANGFNPGALTGRTNG